MTNRNENEDKKHKRAHNTLNSWSWADLLKDNEAKSNENKA